MLRANCRVSLLSGSGAQAHLEVYAVSLCVVCNFCVSVCQLVLVCPGYDCKLPTPSAGASDLCLLKRGKQPITYSISLPTIALPCTVLS